MEGATSTIYEIGFNQQSVLLFPGRKRGLPLESVSAKRATSNSARTIHVPRFSRGHFHE